jgi:hypothetical protein
MLFNKLTFNISLGVLIVTGLYALLYSGLTGVLLASAVAMIAAAFLNEFELVVAATVLFVIIYTFFIKRFVRRWESFENPDQASKDIVTRLSKMERSYQQEQQNPAGPCRAPAGVYNPSVEGFEDVSKDNEEEGAPSDSSPASTANTVKPGVDPELSHAVSANIDETKEKAKEEFQSATGGLFKLGQMPSEHKDGPKLDAGQTLVTAMKSLDPSTVSQMTDGTKQLLETQKSLMGMLKNMSPVLAEGRELLSTFSGMFGGNNSSGPLKM